MRFFYSIGIRLYTFIVWLASIKNEKAKLWLKGRRNWTASLDKIPKNAKPIWIHCSSLGEFEQGRPLIEAIKEKHSDAFILLTFYSPSGYEIRKNYDKADLIMYLPTDTLSNAKKFVRKVNPKLAIFIKYEFWFNYIKVLYRYGVPLYSVSAIFRENQMFFKPIGKWFKKHLNYFTWIFVQNEKSSQLLLDAGVENVSICGDTRYDRVYAIAKESKSVKEIEVFSAGHFTIVAGSTWAVEDQMLVELVNSVPQIKLVVAPHELHEKTYLYYENEVKGKVVRLSRTSASEASEAKVLLIDSIGLLASIYKYGQIAIVGGGFGKGIHNILEPSVYGMPVIFGPRYEKFFEAVTMISEGLVHTVNSYSELQKTIKSYINNKDYLAGQSEKITAFVEHQLGATGVVLQAIEAKLVS
jgi:3-deoxy-D-manno-octulosonic-acid transferase